MMTDLLPDNSMTVGDALDQVARLADEIDEIDRQKKAPIDIFLSNSEIDENQADSTMVGVLSVEDNSEGSYIYSLLFGMLT